MRFLRVVSLIAAAGCANPALGDLSLAADLLSTGDGELPASPRVACVDVFAMVSSGDTWTAAGVVGTTHSGVTLRYSRDSNDVVRLTNPGLADRFVTFFSAPRDRDSNSRYTNGGAAAAGRYAPPGPTAVASTTEVNVAYFSSPPPNSNSPTISGAIFRIAIELPEGWTSSDVFYSATSAIPPGASLAFSCAGPAPSTTGVAAGSFDVPALVGFDWFLYHDPLAPDFTFEPQDSTVCAGGAAFISAGWLSPVPVTYQWEFNGQPIAGESGIAVAGVQQRTLEIPIVAADDAGSYRLLLQENPQNGRYRYSRSAELVVTDGVPLSLAYVSNAGNNSVVALDSATGAFLRYVAPPGTISYPNGIATDRNGDVYVASSNQDQVIKYNWRTAEVAAVFMNQTLLDAPVGVCTKEDSSGRWLYVVGYLSENLVRFNLDQPTESMEVVDLALVGARSPGALSLEPDGRLLIAAEDADVVVQLSPTGAFERIAAAGCGLNLPSGMLRRANGELLVSSLLTDSVLRYLPSGQCLGAFITPGAGGLSRPYGISSTSNGDLLVISSLSNQILRFSGVTGVPLSPFAENLHGPLYMSTAQVCDNDCNSNLHPDRWEIDLGLADDCNGNSIPDECEDGLAPSFVQVPTSATRCAGEDMQFAAGATGVGPLAYRWRRGTTELFDGPSPGGGIISGSASSTLTISSVGIADSASNYNVVVTSPCGAATSPSAALTVNPVTTITAHPESETACEDSVVTFSVAAIAAPPVTYQWYKGATPIFGATQPSYTLSGVEEADEGAYRVVVSATCGQATSDPAILAVEIRPQILTEPADQIACSGRAAAFTVVASGPTAQLQYQWRRNLEPIPGATTATLLLQLVTPDDAGEYDVVVYLLNSGCAAQSQSAALTVNVTPGDVTYDGEVDLLDLTTLLSNFGVQTGADWTDGDLTGDGDVDLSDLTVLLSTFGNVCS